MTQKSRFVWVLTLEDTLKGYQSREVHWVYDNKLECQKHALALAWRKRRYFWEHLPLEMDYRRSDRSKWTYEKVFWNNHGLREDYCTIFVTKFSARNTFAGGVYAGYQSL